MSKTPQEALIKQRVVIDAAIAALVAARDSIPSSTDALRCATWVDVAGQAHVVDAILRAELV